MATSQSNSEETLKAKADQLSRALRGYTDRHEATCNPAGLPEYDAAVAALDAYESMDIQPEPGMAACESARLEDLQR